MNDQLSNNSNKELGEESIELLELSDDSIEILEFDDDSLDVAAVRKSFRIPIREKNRVLIVIRGTSFPIEDINSKGAGVLMIEDQSFFKGQELSDCELIIGQEKFHGVKCQIVHVTSMKGSTPRFGVKWLNMDAVSTVLTGTKQIGDICDELKKNLLEDNNQDLEDNDLMQG